MGLTQSRRAVAATTRIHRAVVQGHEPVTSAAQHVKKNLLSEGSRLKDDPIEVSEEDYDMLKMHEKDPKRAEQILKELNDKYRKEHDEYTANAQREIDQQQEMNVPEQKRQFTQKTVQPGIIKDNSQNEDDLEFDDKRDEEFLQRIGKLSDNIVSRTIRTPDYDIGKPKARPMENISGRVELKPTRNQAFAQRFNDETSMHHIPGTFTTFNIKQLMDEMKERIANEQEKNFNDPDIESKIENIRKEMIDTFARENQIDSEVLTDVLTYSTSPYILKISERTAYGFWHKPVYPPMWGYQMKRKVVKDDEE